MKAFIKIGGQTVSVEITVEVYEYLDRAKHKNENLIHEQRRHWDRREFDEYIVVSESSRCYYQAPEQWVCRKETLQEIMTALESCTKIQCQRFLLFVLDGLSYSEIGKLCGCSKYAVRDSIEAVRKKKGSLIQALLYDDTADTYKYLLAKVEHSDFVDDTDFTFKTGFSKDKKTIWKSCLFDIVNPEAEVFNAIIYLDTKAKYWSSDFLELEEVISDEKNIISAFSAIDETLNRNVKRGAPQDYTFLRNAFIPGRGRA